eukprot:Tbor_TRINITY_DN5123_c0_g2::TRINITY_DN5123_c0_g2_i1::g.25944::m.25944/K07179/RIOK2; RIO kinase 2
MVKLDVSLMRFMEEEDFRCLTAMEMAMRNHEIAPTALIERIAQLPHGGVKKRLNNLLKHKLIHHESKDYDGYSMKYGAYDLLAFRTFSKRGSVAGVGTRIGCGKESDIILIEDENGNEAVCKLQRLGRCSFRSVTRNRDYKNGKTRRGESWFFLSRLAAQKEFAFMKMLFDEGFPVPKPIDQNRHAVVMEKIDGVLLNHIQKMPEAQKVYERCLNLIVKLAQHGLIHGDFNEFNVLVREGDLRVVVIDFPQMVSTDHPNAAELFDRDVENISIFFTRRFRIPTPMYPKLQKDVVRVAELDKQAMASGYFSKNQQQELERLLAQEQEESSWRKESNKDGDNNSDMEEDDELSQNECLQKEGTVEMLPRPSEMVAEGDEVYSEDELEDGEAVNDCRGSCSSASDMKKTDEEIEEGKPSVEEPAKRTKKVKLVQRSKNGTTTTIVYTKNDDGSSFVKKGGVSVDESEIKANVKRMGMRAEDREFNTNLHRNTQKGREKSKVKNQIKNAKSVEYY